VRSVVRGLLEDEYLQPDRKVQTVTLIVRAEGPSGRAKIHSVDPRHALSLVYYLRTIGYNAWIEDTNGDLIEETVLKNAIKSSS
jgi:hypothetical protein